MYELDEKIYFYLLTAIPVMLLLFLYIMFWKRRKQKEFGDLELIDKLSPEKSVFKPILKFFIIALAFIMLVIGLVNPKIGTKLETVKREGIDIVFALDVSKSMLAEDIAPSRLEKSKQIVSQLINQMGSDRIGIIAYAGSAFPVLPVTTDYGVAKMFLQSMNPGMVSSQGTALNEAIELSEKFFDKADKANRLLILISDGEDHGSGAEQAAKEATKTGIKILTIGVGTAAGGPIPFRKNGVVTSFQRDNDNQVVVTKLNEESLREIAKNSKGYVNGNNTKDVVNYVKNALDNIEKTEFESTQMADFQSQFQWFLGMAFVLLFLDVFLLERQTMWIKNLDLFNEKKKL